MGRDKVRGLESWNVRRIEVFWKAKGKQLLIPLLPTILSMSIDKSWPSIWEFLHQYSG